MSARAAVFGTIVWAAGFLVSAVALKGNPIGDWIEGGRPRTTAEVDHRYGDENGAR
jgi:hypothetical protein